MTARERSEFEQCAVLLDGLKRWPMTYNAERNTYYNGRWQLAWEVWQGRATLAESDRSFPGYREPLELKRQLQVAHNVLREFGRYCRIDGEGRKCDVCLEIESLMNPSDADESSAGVSPTTGEHEGIAGYTHRPQERGISAEAPGYREMREALGITSEDVYLALKGQLDHSMAYIDNDPEVTNLSSITVDGIVDCEDMADFLNRKRAALDKART